MARCWVGIDCGFTGGIAAIIDGAPMPSLWEMPTTQYSVSRVRKGKRVEGTETELATHRVVMLLEELRNYDPFVFIEKAQLRPATQNGDRKGQGVVSQAKFFGQFTELRGVLYAMKISFEPVHPATWKANIFHGQTRTNGDEESESAKEIARQKAIQLFPVCAQKLSLKKSHGMAEALLIAEYGRRRNDVDAPF